MTIVITYISYIQFELTTKIPTHFWDNFQPTCPLLHIINALGDYSYTATLHRFGIHGLRRSEPIAAALPGRRAAGLRRGTAAGPDLGTGAAAAAGARPQRDPGERAWVVAKALEKCGFHKV